MFTLSEALEAIKGKSEFSVNVREFGTVIDYNVSMKDTFIGNTPRETTILQNLRGVCFGIDGKIVRLPYHKFHNLNENEAYAAANFDFNKPHIVLEKLDGSMIAPIIFPDGHWEFGTRAGVTDVAKKATAFMERMAVDAPEKHWQYMTFVNVALSMNWTPIFEYCARDQRIVIDYPETKLILTALRCMETGKYQPVSLSRGASLPMTSCAWDRIGAVREVYSSNSTIAELASVVKDLKGEEGVVVRFDDGRFVKIKAADYVLKHRALDGLKFEKDVLKLILENGIDDVIPLVTPEMVVRLETYQASVLEAIRFADEMVGKIFASLVEESGGDRKAFAAEAVTTSCSNLLFAKFGGKDGSVASHVRKHCSTQTDVDSVRNYIGKSWNET